VFGTLGNRLPAQPLCWRRTRRNERVRTELKQILDVVRRGTPHSRQKCDSTVFSRFKLSTFHSSDLHPRPPMSSPAISASPSPHWSVQRSRSSWCGANINKLKCSARQRNAAVNEPRVILRRGRHGQEGARLAIHQEDVYGLGQ